MPSNPNFGLHYILLFIFAFLSHSLPTRTALSGEDDWMAQPMFISPFVGSSNPDRLLLLDQIRTAYGLPYFRREGTTIAIVDAYDIDKYSELLQYFFNPIWSSKQTALATLMVLKMPGTAPPPPSNIDWHLEACLDVEWAHAIAPNAKILLVEATSAQF